MDESIDLQMEAQSATAVQLFESHLISSIVSSPRLSVLSEDEVDREVLAFLCDGSGRRSPSPTPEPTWNNFTLDAIDAMSPASVNTVISAGTLVMDLSELLQTIADRHSLRGAEIRSVEQYYIWTGTVYHRFLTLELFRVGRKAIWVRLDRHRGGTLKDLWEGTAPAHDEALLKADKESLIRGATHENKQIFASKPTLAELKSLLESITKEMKFYTVWPENCYFFCSLIEQHLGENHGGIFLRGELYRPAMAQGVRDRVSELARSIAERPIKPSLKDFFQKLDPGGTWPFAQMFLDLSYQLDQSDISHTKTPSQAVQQLCQLVVKVNDFLCQTYDRNFARSVHRVVHQYLHKLRDWAELKAVRVLGDIHPHYYAFLHSYSLLLGETMLATHILVNAEQDASIPGELSREFPIALANYKPALHHPYHALFTNDAVDSWVCQSSSLELHATTLGLAGDVTNACAIFAVLVNLQRQLVTHHATGATHHQHLLHHSLHQYCKFLCDVNQLDDAYMANSEATELLCVLYPEEPLLRLSPIPSQSHPFHSDLAERERHLAVVCHTFAEHVATTRLLYTRRPDKYYPNLSVSLQMYSIRLCEARRYDEACDPGKEEVEMMRALYAKDAVQYHLALCASLRRYCTSLRLAGRDLEASGVQSELMRICYAMDPCRKQQSILVAALCIQGKALQEANRYSEACEAGFEAFGLARELYAEGAEEYSLQYSRSLGTYVHALREAGRHTEICEVRAEDVALKRVLRTRQFDKDRQSRALSNSLHLYGISLGENGQLSEACAASAEAVELVRTALAVEARKPNVDELAIFDQFEGSLRSAGRLEDAGSISQEVAALRATKGLASSDLSREYRAVLGQIYGREYLEIVGSPRDTFAMKWPLSRRYFRDGRDSELSLDGLLRRATAGVPESTVGINPGSPPTVPTTVDTARGAPDSNFENIDSATGTLNTIGMPLRDGASPSRSIARQN